MPEETPVDSPIVVFISSQQNEFQELRDALKQTIDGEALFRKFIMKAELVERRAGTRIQGDISAALKRSTIYLGIFGNRYSKIVRQEYEEARRRGRPLIIFDIIDPKGAKSKRDKRVQRFLESQVKDLDDVRVTSVHARPSKPEEMLDIMIQRIASVVTELVNENVEVRRIVNPQ